VPSALAVAALVLLASTPAASDDVPTPNEAIEKARALERQGLVADAEDYLAGLVDENGGPLARDATVLLEAARIATAPEKCRAYASRAIERSRSDQVLETAHMLRGDSFFAEGRYTSAGHEYLAAARHSNARGPGIADLKRARSSLASGDAGQAAELYREIAEWGATPGEITPYAEVGLARSILVLGRFAEAAERFLTTARVYADSEIRVRALAGAAEAFGGAGDTERERAALESIVASYPESYEAVIARERLRRIPPPDTVSAGPGEHASTPEGPSGTDGDRAQDETGER